MLNFFKACQNILWKNALPNSFITKTISIQALFDILKQISKDAIDGGDIRPQYLEALLCPAKNINFADELYRNISGSERKEIREVLEKELKIRKA